MTAVKRSFLTLFTSSNCCLCNEAKVAIESVRKSIDFDFEQVDINSSPEHYQKFKYDIPVLYVNNAPFCRHRVDSEKLMEKLLENKV